MVLLDEIPVCVFCLSLLIEPATEKDLPVLRHRKGQSSRELEQNSGKPPPSLHASSIEGLPAVRAEVCGLV